MSPGHVLFPPITFIVQGQAYTFHIIVEVALAAGEDARVRLSIFNSRCQGHEMPGSDFQFSIRDARVRLSIFNSRCQGQTFNFQFEMPGSDFQFSIRDTPGSSENGDAGRHARLKTESPTLHLDASPSTLYLCAYGASGVVSRKTTVSDWRGPQRYGASNSLEMSARSRILSCVRPAATPRARSCPGIRG